MINLVDKAIFTIVLRVLDVEEVGSSSNNQEWSISFVPAVKDVEELMLSIKGVSPKVFTTSILARAVVAEVY